MNTLRSPARQPFSLLDGGGEMGSLMRAIKWEQTSLGPPEDWPQSLKTAVRILLTSQQPMFVWWGPDLVNLYNDAYRAVLGARHPAALARPAATVWKEIWDQVGPRVHSSLVENQGTFDEALFLLMERNGYPEETYFTFSYSPIPDDHGEPGGILCANTEETQHVISRRRLATQQELAARTTDASTIAEAGAACIAALATNPHDLPFSLLYLKQPATGHFTLVNSSNAAFEEPEIWRLEDTFTAGQPALVELPPGISFPSGAWNRPPKRAVVLPINASQIGQSAILVAALNPHRPYNDTYEAFLALLATQIGLALNSARAYQEERRRAESLAELDRAKTTFFSNISHEFRTPLTLMLGPLEDLLAQPDGLSPSPGHEALEIVHRNAIRLQKLVNALLDFSRIEAGRMSARLLPIDLASFTAELASTFRSAMERAKLRFSVECSSLPRPVYIDPEMWEKIVLNLLSNALKYTFEGSVKLSLVEAAGQVQLSVSDTGTGIPEHELSRLFERFHRVEGARGRTYEGTGIGLALVQELTRLHDGSVAVVSEVGRGSTFTVSLPFGDAQVNPAVGTPPSGPHPALGNAYLEEVLGWLPRSGETAFLPSPESSCSDAGRSCILLADDNADMRDYVQRLLASEYNVVVASNGRRALDIAVEQLPDLVLSDIMMPELDGFGLLKGLRANPATRAIPLVFLSARAGEEASAEGREAGADDYIVKPFTARELLARVRGTLQIHQERRRAAEQLNEVFTQAPVAILVLRGPELIVELANPSYHALMQGRELVGRPLSEALPDVGQHVWDAIQSVLKTGEPFIAKESLIPFDDNDDGALEDHWFNLVYHPWRDSQGVVAGLIAVLSDVSQQVRARKEVERVNRELEEFAYVASHDLQEPLRMVNIYTHLLVQRLEKLNPEQVQKYSGFIGDGVRRMEQLIRDLLSFARTVQSEAPVSQAVPLDRALEKALEVLRAQIEEKNARIDVGSLPVVMGDETQLPQLFQNLLSNAIKYSKPGVPPVIQISSERLDTKWIIAIRDNGIGFKQEYAEHIFGLFKRLHRDEYVGTGLGLAICKRIVERFGGRIWVESVPDEGSKFSFSLLSAE